MLKIRRRRARQAAQVARLFVALDAAAAARRPASAETGGRGGYSRLANGGG
jgi:hypothetical protein